MPSLIEPAGPGVVIEWNPAGLADLYFNPDGPLAEMLHTMGRIVTAGAKSRALVRTGRMRDDITYQLTHGPKGAYVQIISPAVNPADSFPYPIVHEEAQPRDRRPHRSLVPALADIRKITATL